MNYANPPFLMLLLDLYQRSELKPIEVIIYSLMFNKYRYYKRRNQPFSPSVHYLSIEAKCSELTVKHALQTFKKLGLIRVLSRGNGITGKASTYEVYDYRDLENIFTRPSTSEIYAAERAAREPEAELDDSEVQEPDSPENAAESDTAIPEPMSETQPEAPQELSTPQDEPEPTYVEKVAENAIEEAREALLDQFIISKHNTVTQQMRDFYNRSLSYPDSTATLEFSQFLEGININD